VTYASGSAHLGTRNAAASDNRPHFLGAQSQNEKSMAGRFGISRSRRFARTQQHRQELQALEEMLLTSRPKFVAIAYGILRNKEDAEDAVQNAFLSAYLHFRAFEGRSALRTWFTRIVLNAALMICRKRKTSRFAPLQEPDTTDDIPWTEQLPVSGPDPEKICVDEEALRRIDAELANMRPALRQAFAMTYYGEMSNREACALLGVSIGTFKARLFRARKLVVSRLSLPSAGLCPKRRPAAGARHWSESQPLDANMGNLIPLEVALP